MPPSPLWRDRRFLRYAVLVILLFVVVRAVFYYQLIHTAVPEYPTLDSEYYYLWGDHVAGGHGQPGGPFWLSPAYPMFIAVLFMGLGTHAIPAVMIAQMVLSLITLTIVLYYTYRLFGWVAALTAGVLAAMYAPWVYYDGVVLSSSFILFVNALMLLLLVTQSGLMDGEGGEQRRRGPAWSIGVWVVLGLLTGVSALARPSTLLFGVVLTGWLLLKKQTSWTVRAACYFAAMLLALTPVLVRNYKVSGSAVLTTSSGGVNFFIGNRAGASGKYDELDFIKSFDPAREAEGYREEASKRIGHPVTLNQASRYWGREALDDIVHAPADWIRLLFKKLWLTIQREEIANNLSFRGVAGFTPILGVLPVRWGLLFPLAAAGAYLAWRRRKDMKLFWLYAASYVAVNLIFFSASEYRFPMLLVMLPAAGCFIADLWRVVVDREYRELVKACAIYVAAMVICNFPSREIAYTVKTHADYYNMATVAVDRDQWIDAIPLYARSLMVNPEYRPARIGLANALWKLGNFDDARVEYAAAGVAPPDSLSGQPLQEYIDELYMYTEDNDYAGALAMLDSTFPVTKDAPATIWVNRAMIEEHLNHQDKAIEALVRAGKKEPESPVYSFHAGQIAEMIGDTLRADSLYRESLKRYPAYAPARVALANMALASGNRAAAKEQFEELRQIRIPQDSVRAQVWRLAANLGESYDPTPPKQSGDSVTSRGEGNE